MSDAYDMDNYPEAVRSFCTYKLVTQNRSVKTVNEYMLDLRNFFRYIYALNEGLPIDRETLEGIDISGLGTDFFTSIRSDDIEGYLSHLKLDLANGVSARARKLSAIRSFYKYCTRTRRLFDVNPAADIETPKMNKTLPKYLSLEESRSLLEAVRNDAENPYRLRDYAMITLFLNCGMRLSELAGITLRDLDKSLRSLRVIGKGSKERIIYLNSACQNALSEYLPYRLSLRREGRPDDHLFLSRLGQGINVKTVQHVVKKYLAAAGLEYKNYSTHKLRHTAATLMYQTGEVDIRVLKDILGHEQLNTTQIYTHVSDKSMESAMEKNPLADVKLPKRARFTPKDTTED